MALALDASVVVQEVLSGDGLRRLAGEQLVASPLLLAETPSVLHELGWRGTISRELADQAWPTSSVRPRPTTPSTWPLARMRRCSLLTLDARLRRRASRVVDVVGPTEL